jgi:two-component system, cell cycle sensor histidine kinase and response regulator CckA
MTPDTLPNALPTVLVVDDEQPIRQLARRVLEGEGYHVTEAGNGLEAIALLKGGAPLNLLVADLNMPGVRGDEMVRQIRVTRPDLKVLYVTGHIERLLDEHPMLQDGEAFLDKPFSAAGLLEAVSLMLYGTLKKKKTADPAPSR